MERLAASFDSFAERLRTQICALGAVPTRSGYMDLLEKAYDVVSLEREMVSRFDRDLVESLLRQLVRSPEISRRAWYVWGMRQSLCKLWITLCQIESNADLMAHLDPESYIRPEKLGVCAAELPNLKPTLEHPTWVETGQDFLNRSSVH